MGIEDVYSNQVAGKGNVSSLHSSGFHKSEIIKDPKFKQLADNTMQSILDILQQHEPNIPQIQEPLAPVQIVSFEQALQELSKQKYE